MNIKQGIFVSYIPTAQELSGHGVPLSYVAKAYKQPLVAMIVAVHSETMVNLTVWDANGNNYGRTSIKVLPDFNEEEKEPFCYPLQVDNIEESTLISK